MSYKVIHYFTDLQDFNHPYNVGDVFPRIGLNVTDARLSELAGNRNKQGKPLIEKIESKTESKAKFEEVVEKTSDLPYTKTEVNRMSTADLKLVALNAGVEDADDLSGAELKKILIKKFGL